MEVVERLKADGQGHEIFVSSNIDERVQKIIPRPHELENYYGGQCRLDQRKHDLAENPEVAAPVNLGSVFQIARDREEELAEQKNKKCCAEKGGKPQWLQRVDHAELGKDKKHRDHGNL